MGGKPSKALSNILSVYNDQLKEIFQVRVNPVLTVGGLKQRIANHYKLKMEDVAIIYDGVRYQTLVKQETRPKKKVSKSIDVTSTGLRKYTNDSKICRKSEPKTPGSKKAQP